jgi:hypothetical protein
MVITMLSKPIWECNNAVHVPLIGLALITSHWSFYTWFNMIRNSEGKYALSSHPLNVVHPLRFMDVQLWRNREYLEEEWKQDKAFVATLNAAREQA